MSKRGLYASHMQSLQLEMAPTHCRFFSPAQYCCTLALDKQSKKKWGHIFRSVPDINECRGWKQEDVWGSTKRVRVKQTDVYSAESLLKPLGGHPNVRVEECPCSTGLNNNEGKKPNTQGMDQFADEPWWKQLWFRVCQLSGSYKKHNVESQRQLDLLFVLEIGWEMISQLVKIQVNRGWWSVAETLLKERK